MFSIQVLMAIVFTKCISQFANDSQFLYYVLKQCLSGLELIRAHWGILNQKYGILNQKYAGTRTKSPQ